ncbi:MAG: CRTAC1 family protein [Phycisphaerales bacterium]|nr:CRTAC1 family protein [Phycisphaerales bacterium]
MTRRSCLYCSLLMSVMWSASCSDPDPAAPSTSTLDLPSSSAVEMPWFVEAASDRGLQFDHHSGHDGTPQFPEIIGGGVALFDLEGDGDLDVYLVQSGALGTIGEPANANALFRNDGNGRFEDVTAEAGDAGDRGYGMGVAAGDVDRDGYVDLYITNYGPDVLLRNNGDGTFVDVTKVAGLGHPGWGASAAFIDYDLDGLLDLAVTNYVQWTPDKAMSCPGPGGRPDYCAPNAYDAPSPDLIYRNEGNMRFRDVSVETGWRTAFGNGLGIVPLDYDDDGLPDLFVANDQRPNQLWRNLGDGTFKDEADVVGVAIDMHGEAKAGMGVDAADVDDDGDLDLLVVNLAAQSDSFFRNEGDWFVDGTAAAGLASASRPYTRFGMGFHDFDNDSYPDLYMANGRVLRRDVVSGDPYAESNLLLKGLPGGRFEAVEPIGGVQPAIALTSRGAAFGDLDGDGGLDLVVVNRDAPASLLMNVVPERGHWASVDLIDVDGGPAELATLWGVLGTREIRRECRTASSYLSANPHRVHVGFGDEPVLTQVRIEWPGGVVEHFGDILAGQSIRLRQGAGTQSQQEH